MCNLLKSRLYAAALLLLCLGAAIGVSGLSADEGVALQRLYSSLGAPIPSFSDQQHCDKWEGATCNSKEPRRVIKLIFQAQGLVGQLPDNVFAPLAALQVIDFTGNPGITGALPSSIGWLLDLQTLSMDGCSLTNYSAELAVPPSIGNLKKLVTLGLSGNRLTGRLPEEIGGLASIFWLDISNNSISGPIPASLGDLSEVGHIHCQMNRLTGSIPPRLFALKHLKHMLFANNMLSGPLQANFSDESELTILDLGGNSFSGPLPPELRFAGNLTQLQLAGNKFSGPFPKEIAESLLALTVVDLSNNSISGSLPNFNSSKLLALLMPSNNLSGPIPPSYATLPALRELHLEDNSLSGNVPGELGDMDKQGSVQFVNLQWNNLTVPAPRSLVSRTGIFAFLGGNPVCDGWEAAQVCIPRSDAKLDQTAAVYPIGDHCPEQKSCRNGSYPNPTFAADNVTRLCSCAYPYIVNLDLLQQVVVLDEESTELLEERLQLLFPDIRRGGVFIRTWKVLSPFSSRPVVISVTSWWFPGDALTPVLDVLAREKIAYNFATHQVFLTKPFATFAFRGTSLPFLPPLEGNGSRPMRIILVAAVLGSAFMLFGIATIIVCFYHMFHERQEKMLKQKLTLQGREVRRYSIKELDRAMTKFTKRSGWLGGGGQGSVYRGLLSDGSIVAIKEVVMDGNKGESEFVTEATLIGAIFNRHVVRLRGYGISKSKRYLVYELMANGSLQDILFPPPNKEDTPQLTWPRFLAIMRGAAAGLAYLHDGCPVCILHCDVKPGNILLDEDYEASMGDFGLAKVMDHKLRQLETALAGTPGFIAPEFVFMGNITSKSDVYSFGITMLVVAARQNPCRAIISGIDLDAGLDTLPRKSPSPSAPPHKVMAAEILLGLSSPHSRTLGSISEVTPLPQPPPSQQRVERQH